MLDDLGLKCGQVRTAGTPRRLAVSVAEVLEHQPDKTIEKTGPSKSVAFDENGDPTDAAVGFAKGQGIDVQDLQIIATDKGEYVAIKKHILGRDARELLAERIPDIILAIPWPKSMKWGEVKKDRWVALLPLPQFPSFL